MADPIQTPQVNPEIQRMVEALTPEYLKGNTNVVDPNAQPGKIPAVEPMNFAPFLTADLIGNAAGAGAKAAGAGLKGAIFAGPLARTRVPYEASKLFPGAEGIMRHEIVDSPMKLLDLGGGPLTSKIEHPELFEAYPELRNWFVNLSKAGKEPGGTAYFDTQLLEARAPDEAGVKSALLHEIQHAVQNTEGMSGGGNTRGVINWLIPHKDLKNMPDDQWNWTARSAFNIYQRLAGEVEARNAARRYAENLYHMPPQATEDVSRHLQLHPNDSAMTDPLVKALMNSR